MTLQRPRPRGRALRPRPSRSLSGHLLDVPELQQIRDADAARERDFDRFSPAALRRWKMYVIGAVLFFPLVTWFFTPAGFEALWFQILVSAAYGTFVAFARPTGAAAASSSTLAGLAILAWTDHAGLGFGLLMSLIIYGLIGAVVGVGERGRLLDGH